VRARVEAEARWEGYVVALQAKDGWMVPQHAVISYEFHWKDKRKRDLDGLVSATKAWQDGIVDAGILTDDDAYHLSIGSVKYRAGANKTVIMITEAK
jgi:Holliday junction resolvase RusA-like endonuclease